MLKYWETAGRCKFVLSSHQWETFRFWSWGCSLSTKKQMVEEQFPGNVHLQQALFRSGTVNFVSWCPSCSDHWRGFRIYLPLFGLYHVVDDHLLSLTHNVYEYKQLQAADFLLSYWISTFCTFTLDQDLANYSLKVKSGASLGPGSLIYLLSGPL